MTFASNKLKIGVMENFSGMYGCVIWRRIMVKLDEENIFSTHSTEYPCCLSLSTVVNVLLTCSTHQLSFVGA